MLWLFLATEFGVQFFYKVSGQKKAPFVIEDMSGSLLTGLSLSGVSVSFNESSLSSLYIDHLYFKANLSDLLVGRVSVDHLWLDQLELFFEESDKKKSFENIFYGIKLPALRLPFLFDVGDINIKSVVLHKKNNTLNFQDLYFLGHWVEEKWVLQEGHFKHDNQYVVELKAHGSSYADYPFYAEARVVFDESLIERLPVKFSQPDINQLKLILKGDINKVQSEINSEGIFNFSAVGTLHPKKEKLPFEFTYHFSLPAFSSSQGIGLNQVTGEGDLNGHLGVINLTTTGDLIVREGEVHPYHLQAKITPKNIDYSAIINSLYGNMAVTGNYHPTLIKGALDIAFYQFSFSEFLPLREIKVDGLLSADFTLGKNASFDLQGEHFNGFLMGKPFDFSFDANWKKDKPLILDHFLLSYGAQELRVKGSLKEVWDVQGDLKDFDLAVFNREIKGKLTGHIDVKGLFAEPDITAVISSAKIKSAFFSSNKEARFNLVMKKLGQTQLEGSLFFSEFVLQKWHGERFDLQFSGNQREHQLTAKFVGDHVRGELLSQGRIASDVYHLTVQSLPIEYKKLKWDVKKQAIFEWAFLAEKASLSMLCLINDVSEFCADYVLKDKLHTFNFSSAMADLSLLNNEESLWLFGGAATAKGRAILGENQPFVIEGVADGAQLSVKNDSSVSPIFFDQLHIESHFDKAKWEVKGVLASHDKPLANAHFWIDNNALRTLGGDLTINHISLAPYALFFEENDKLGGTLNAQIRLGGQLASPEFYGILAVEQGLFALPRYKVSLENIQLKSILKGKSAGVDAQYQVAEAKGMVKSDIDWSEVGLPKINAQITGNRFHFVYDLPSEFWISPNVNFSMNAEKIKLEGDINIDQAKVIKRGGSQKIGLSKDVVVLEEEFSHPATLAQLGTFDLNVGLHLGKKTVFDVYGAKGRLEGQLRLSHRKNKIQANGVLTVAEGQYTAWGQELKIRKGSIDFNGPLDRPMIEIEAVREVKRDNLLAGLLLQGSAQNAVSHLFYEPLDTDEPLSQVLNDQQILSYILLGRSTFRQQDSGAQNQEQTLMTQAAVALGLKGGKSLVGRTPDKWGLKEVEIDTSGSGSELQVTVGKEISEDLYIQYAKGVFAPISQTILRYQLSSKWYLEAVSGLDQALDLIYSISF